MSLGSCHQRAWVGGANGHVLEAAPFLPLSQSTSPRVRKRSLSLCITLRTAWQLSSKDDPLRFPPQPLPRLRRALCSAAPVTTGWVSHRKGREERKDAVCGLCGLRRPGATPAAEVTVGEVDRGHELLHTLESGAPVLQQRCYRHGDAPSLPGRSLVLSARCAVWNQRFRHPTSTLQTRAAFLGTPRLFQEAGFGEPSW